MKNNWWLLLYILGIFFTIFAVASIDKEHEAKEIERYKYFIQSDSITIDYQKKQIDTLMRKAYPATFKLDSLVRNHNLK